MLFSSSSISEVHSAHRIWCIHIHSVSHALTVTGANWKHSCVILTCSTTPPAGAGMSESIGIQKYRHSSLLHCAGSLEFTCRITPTDHRRSTTFTGLFLKFINSRTPDDSREILYFTALLFTWPLIYPIPRYMVGGWVWVDGASTKNWFVNSPIPPIMFTLYRDKNVQNLASVCDHSVSRPRFEREGMAIGYLKSKTAWSADGSWHSCTALCPPQIWYESVSHLWVNICTNSPRM